MPTLTIDNRTVTVPEGTNVLEAAKCLGIVIPHYLVCDAVHIHSEKRCRSFFQGDPGDADGTVVAIVDLEKAGGRAQFGKDGVEAKGVEGKGDPGAAIGNEVILFLAASEQGGKQEQTYTDWLGEKMDPAPNATFRSDGRPVWGGSIFGFKISFIHSVRVFEQSFFKWLRLNPLVMILYNRKSSKGAFPG